MLFSRQFILRCIEVLHYIWFGWVWRIFCGMYYGINDNFLLEGYKMRGQARR